MSVDAFQPSVIDVCVLPVAERPVGVVGACVSPAGQAEELSPFGDQVRRRFEAWMAQQATAGRRFTEAQRRWLEMMRDHIATSLELEVEDFSLTPFVEEGGLGRARQVFGQELGAVVEEMNEVLAA